MKFHIITLSLFCLLINLNCDFLNSVNEYGSIRVSFNSNTQLSPNKSTHNSNHSIDRAIFFLVDNDGIIYFEDMKTSRGVFNIKINKLNINSKYTITIYGKIDSENFIDLSASHSDITLEKNRTTEVNLSWQPFQTEIITPVNHDTLDGTQNHFEWTPVHGAKEYEFVLIKNNAPYYNRIVKNVRTTSSGYQFDEPLEKGEHFFNIQCIGLSRGYKSIKTQKHTFYVR